jgi:hypothetical protein
MLGSGFRGTDQSGSVSSSGPHLRLLGRGPRLPSDLLASTRSSGAGCPFSLITSPASPSFRPGKSRTFHPLSIGDVILLGVADGNVGQDEAALEERVKLLVPEQLKGALCGAQHHYSLVLYLTPHAIRCSRANDTACRLGSAIRANAFKPRADG